MHEPVSEDRLLSMSKAAEILGTTTTTLTKLVAPVRTDPVTGRRWYTLRSIRRQLDNTDGGAAA